MPKPLETSIGFILLSISVDRRDLMSFSKTLGEGKYSAKYLAKESK